MIQPQIDALLAWAAPLHDDIVACKNEYFAATGGEVHEDDACFEQRMQGFFNFYLFDRKGPDGITPVQRYLRERGATLGGQDKEALMGCTNSRIGLYQYRGRGSLLRRVPKGHVRVRDAITARALHRQTANGSQNLSQSFPGCDLLTQREREVLALIAASATNKEAAVKLGISQRTVEIHRAHIMHKLGAKNSVDLARKVMGQERRA